MDKIIANNTIFNTGNFLYINNFSSSSLTKISLLEAFQYSTTIFISQIPSNLYLEDNLKWIMISERVLGLGFIALFIVVLTKKMIR